MHLNQQEISHYIILEAVLVTTPILLLKAFGGGLLLIHCTQKPHLNKINNPFSNCQLLKIKLNNTHLNFDCLYKCKLMIDNKNDLLQH